MDYSSQVVDPTPAHDYAGYVDEGFAGYDRMAHVREGEGVPSFT